MFLRDRLTKETLETRESSLICAVFKFFLSILQQLTGFSKFQIIESVLRFDCYLFSLGNTVCIYEKIQCTIYPVLPVSAKRMLCLSATSPFVVSAFINPCYVANEFR